MRVVVVPAHFCLLSVNEPAQLMLRIALVEDDDIYRDKILIPGLRRFGIDATGYVSIAALRASLFLSIPEIVLVDRRLPDGDGLVLVQELRLAHSGIGLVMLSSIDNVRASIEGLKMGADAYLSKAVDIDVIAATLHSLARRLPLRAIEADRNWRKSHDAWCLISPGGDVIALTQSERTFCSRLLDAPGQLVPRAELVESLSDTPETFDEKRLDAIVKRLRAKVAKRCGSPLPVWAVRGQGYVFGDAALLEISEIESENGERHTT